ncbi:SPOR domain-containing protein [uncultured Sphingomonas sp.]|uniref:SPOR domain-containing protein n=1 Tax=uncultured Sphingomonas sp. TaxID=158754 RepID=UPI0025F57EF2|nr:SPOR domain-containing protein [uncultured Sphingomonas sp.]
MAEIRRGVSNDGQGSQRLPWLEPVEDEDDYPEPRRGGDWRKWGLVLAAVAVAAVILVLMLGGRGEQKDVGTLIKADSAPYKVRPADPGGLKVDNNDRIAQRTGVGSDINSPLDLAALPEQPIVGAGAPRSASPAEPRRVPVAKAPAANSAATPASKTGQPAPKQTVAPPPPPPPPPPPEPVSVPGGHTVQLGAFSSEGKAKSAWKTLSKRFAYLAPLTPVILPVKSGDSTLYRLRATGGAADTICAKMKVAGEACAVTN